MTDFTSLIQGSEEWLLARAGSLGASRVHDALARIKTGWGASRANIMADLICERLTGKPVDRFVNAAMAHGTETEPAARRMYEFMHDVEVEQVGIVLHPKIRGTHASPDGMIGTNGLLEIKCPATSTHLDTLLGAPIPGKYITQMQWQMCCCEREWCDWVSFDDRLPASMHLYIKRVFRDDGMIAQLETEVRSFLQELDEKIGKLTELYARAA